MIASSNGEVRNGSNSDFRAKVPDRPGPDGGQKQLAGQQSELKECWKARQVLKAVHEAANGRSS